MVSPHDAHTESTVGRETTLNPSDEDIVDGVPSPDGGPGPRAWALTLALALSAALIAWACSEMSLVPEIGSGMRGTPNKVTPQVPATRNAMMTFGILGAVLGLGLGLAGGLTRRSILWSILAATIGLVLGGAAGAAFAG